MQYQEWSKDFETGINAIDKDHQTLFDTIKQLGDQIHQGHGTERVAATIESLILYVDEHFDREERFLLGAGYPDYDAHKKEHDACRDAIFSLRDFHKENPDDVDAAKIVKFLEDWLSHHILQVDMAYQPYLTGEKKGDPKIQNRVHTEALIEDIPINCPIEKEDQVRNFIALISEGSEEGVLVEAAVEKITKVQNTRRAKKARDLFGA